MLDGEVRNDKFEFFDETEYDAIWSDNVIQWLCGDDTVEKQKLIDRISSCD